MSVRLHDEMLILQRACPSCNRLRLRTANDRMLLMHARLLALGNPTCQRAQQALARSEFLRMRYEVSMTNVLSPPPNTTRRQIRRFHRACLVHAAGEATMHQRCVVTRLYLTPWEPIDDRSDPPIPGIGPEAIASGARIPRSLRRIYERNG